MAGLPEAAGGLGGSAYDSAIIAEELAAACCGPKPMWKKSPSPRLKFFWRWRRIRGSAGPRRNAPDTRARLRRRHEEIRHGCTSVRYATGVLATERQENGTGGRTACGHACWFRDGQGTGITLFELPAAGSAMRAFTTIDDRACRGIAAGSNAGHAGRADRGGVARDQASARLRTRGGSAEALGAMQRAFELTRDYLLTRRQYGQVIGDFQA